MKEPMSGKLVHGVFGRVLGPELSPSLRARLRAVGLDLDSSALAPSFPREVWYRAVALTAADLFPAEAEPEQLRRLGRHLIDSLEPRGIVRGAWLKMARLVGPRRALTEVARWLDESPVALVVAERGRKAVVVSVAEHEQLELIAGLLEATGAALGARHCAVTVEERSGWGTRFLLAWE
jgi:uncharacterized protein (TIGR02265 family)